MTRTERLLRLARLRGDRAAELILTSIGGHMASAHGLDPEIIRWRTDAELREHHARFACEGWTEAELREAWGR